MSALSRYRDALAAVSARTGTPLSSLVLSFGILHELTAIVPLVGIFYTARTLGVGERVVASPPHRKGQLGRAEMQYMGRRWPAVGRAQRIVGDVANAVVAYAATKALLPVRIGASLYLSPMFSRAVIDPTRRAFVGVFRRVLNNK
ncbi:hypothetical protein MSAN_01677000 [Mycena sanguinolenta]|uniref:Uncharacterized protein n=1 Tax=Mycena sanguinolenta TaxID=230812 RepID=A0A8H7CUV2_9AGAR|nr:hypothetical protein MSAN_01677000 [Mycena sanguinolenta]